MNRGRYPLEMRRQAVDLVAKLRPGLPSQWAAIETVAARLGVHTSTVREWVRGAEARLGPQARIGGESAEIARLRAELDAALAANAVLLDQQEGR